MDTAKIAVVIPCYRVKKHILSVVDKCGPEVWRIYVVDDCCPEKTGAFVKSAGRDSRVTVIEHAHNQGVGGAVMSGYRAALADGADVVVKVDGDGQMDPKLIPLFTTPILNGEADYTKGNRFYNIEDVRSMPKIRLFGNAVLSFLTKLSSGYWNLFDPTNGYTALHANVAALLPFEKISRRYFFETDILFRLNTLRAVVVDVPMQAKYADEVSSLNIRRVVGEFLCKHLKNFGKRIFYNYYLRDMSIASIELPVGLLLSIFGIAYGGYHWLDSAKQGVPAPSGTVVLSAVAILMGVQFLLAFLNYDIAQAPRHVLHRRLYRAQPSIGTADASSSQP